MAKMMAPLHNIQYAVRRAYLNMQLITVCAVVKSNFQRKMCSFCIVNWPIAMFCAVINPA